MITVTFTPSPAAISENATLTVTDNAANSPQSVNLNGTGAVVTAMLSPASLNFGNQPVGQPTAPMSVFLSASTSIGLNISSIAITGPNAADFTQTNNCGASVPADSSCRIDVIFTPSIGGAESASLVVTDNAAPGMQTVALTDAGTGSAGFTLTPAPGAGTQITVRPGSTATFNIILTPSPGSSGTVIFNCSGNPPTTICAVTPPTAVLTGSTPIPLVVTLRTNCTTQILRKIPSGPIDLPFGLPSQIVVLWLASLAALGLVRRFTPKNRLARFAPALALVLSLVSLAGCGSSGTTAAVPGAPTTPPGLYTITVTATSGSVTQSIPLLVRVI
jgi:hypothetical protein